MDRSFNGSLPQFIAAFLDGKKISETDADKIMKMIDTYPLQTAISIGFWIWLAGLFALLGHSAISCLRLKSRLNTATPIRDNVFETDMIDSPFVCGFFKPAIYPPFGLVEFDRDMVIKHETAHLQRFDHWIKLIACLALAIHWFNPFVWNKGRCRSRWQIILAISCLTNRVF